MSCRDFWPPVTMTTLNFPVSYLDNVLDWLLTSCHHDNFPGLDEEESVIFTLTPLLTQEVPSPMTPSTFHLQSSLSLFHIPHNELGLQTSVLISRISLGNDQLHSYTFGLQETPWHHSWSPEWCQGVSCSPNQPLQRMTALRVGLHKIPWHHSSALAMKNCTATHLDDKIDLDITYDSSAFAKNDCT